MKRILIFGVLTLLMAGIVKGQSHGIDTRVDGTKSPAVGKTMGNAGQRVKMQVQMEPLGPIRLTLGDNKIDLRDFIVDYTSISQVKFDDLTIPVKERIAVIPAPKGGVLHDLTLTVSGEEINIPVFKSNKSKVVFEYKASSDNVANVCWAGSLNGWNKTSHPLQKDKSGLWKLTMEEIMVSILIAFGRMAKRSWTLIIRCKKITD
jgi:hypothetical protein